MLHLLFSKMGIMTFTVGVLLLASCASPGYSPGNLSGNLTAEVNLPEQLKENYLQVSEEIALFYETRGSGKKTALVLHGGPGYPHQEPWEGLSSLDDDYTFIYYHQRGCGKSTRPLTEFTSRNYYKNMVTLIDQLGISAQLMDIERIRRILGEEKITLVGHSFGGFLAALYAAEFPERVDKLLLVAPAEVVVMNQNQGGGLYDHIASQLPPEMLGEYEEYLNRFFDYGSLFDKTEAELSGLNGGFTRYYLAAAGETKVPDASYTPGEIGGFMMHGIFFSMGKEHDYSVFLENIIASTLILAGDADFGISLESIQDQYLHNIPGAKFQIIPGATHFMMDNKTGEFSQIAGHFLAQ